MEGGKVFPCIEGGRENAVASCGRECTVTVRDEFREALKVHREDNGGVETFENAGLVDVGEGFECHLDSVVVRDWCFDVRGIAVVVAAVVVAVGVVGKSGTVCVWFRSPRCRSGKHSGCSFCSLLLAAVPGQ